MNEYVAGGYGAAAVIIGLYALYVRRRARVLTRTLPPVPPADGGAAGTRS